MTTDIKAWCAKCGEPADTLKRDDSGVLIGVPCTCDAGLKLRAENDHWADCWIELASAYKGLAEHLMECADCWHDRRCTTRAVYLRDIRQLEDKAHAAV